MPRSPNLAQTLPEVSPWTLPRTLPELGPNFAQSQPELGPNFARTLPELSPNLPKLCPKLAWSWHKVSRTLPELCPNFVWSQPELCPNFARTCLNFAWSQPELEWKIPWQNLIAYFPITPIANPELQPMHSLVKSARLIIKVPRSPLHPNFAQSWP